MGIKRFGKHLLANRSRVRRAFPPKALANIEQAIKAGEATHAGQIRFVVEGALDGAPLLRNQSARARALDVFSHLRIWDTAHNNGVLIYRRRSRHRRQGRPRRLGEHLPRHGSGIQERQFRGRRDQGNCRSVERDRKILSTCLPTSQRIAGQAGRDVAGKAS
jgi:hypothetical protein